MKSVVAPRSISDILQNDLNPDSWPGGAPPLLVATPHWKQMRQRTDLPIFPRQLEGPRKAVREFTFGGLTAKWPKDHLVETRAPFLIYSVAGVSDCCFGNYVLQVPAGQAVLVPGGVPRQDGHASLQYIEDNPHRASETIRFNEHSRSLHIWVTQDRGNRHYNAGNKETLISSNIRLLRLLNDMEEIATSRSLYHEKITFGLLNVFLLSVQSDLNEGKLIQPGRIAQNEVVSVTDYNPINEAQQYVREHLDQPLTQDSVARVVRLSRTQFIRRFHQEVGQTFNEFVTACRIEHAKVLLLETDYTLRFIRESIGFQSPSYFKALFQKHTGISPAEYRASK